eukprot:1767241-Pyramimonas_sp.AAC.1
MCKRSRAGQEKDALRRFAKKAAERYQRWFDAGPPPARMCRLMGETEGERPLCHPFANLIQRFLSDPRFHHQMTAARTETGKKAWTIEDMRDACDIHDHSVRIGFAGRRNWWLNSGRLDRGTRQER